MKTALHSISYGGTWGQKKLAIEDFIIKASELGFDGVMLAAKRPHLSILDMTPERIEKLRSLMEKEKIKLASIAGYTDFTIGLNKPDTPVIEMQIKYVQELAKLAKSLGGNIVRIFTGYTHPDISFNQQWKCCVKALKECAQAAADYDVTLTIQNHHDIGVHYQSQIDLLEEINEPNCKAGFDAWSVVLAGEDIVKSAKTMAKCTAHTIVADYVKRPRFVYQPDIVNYKKDADIIKAVKMGHGFIDYRTFLKTLAEEGYDGYVIYEMCSPLKGGGTEKNLDEYARCFLDYMQKLEI